MTDRCAQHELIDAKHVLMRACVALVFMAGALGLAGDLRAQIPSPPEETWVRFEGTCTLAGRAEKLPLGPGRMAAIARMSGTLLLHGETGLGSGFLGQIIVMTDTQTGTQGRAAWTDDKGDQIFSEFTGDPMDPDRHVKGVIMGGTGRFEGIVGSYEFKWQFVVRTEEGEIQGRTIDLKGKARISGSRTGTTTPQPGGGRP